MQLNHQNTSQSQSVVSKAMLRAAEKLSVSNVELSQIVDISTPRLSKISHMEAEINSSKKEFELALFFIRIYRSLDAIVGGDDKIAAKWLRNHNTALKAVPIERMKKIDGLIDVLSYLDSRRARI